MRLKLSIASNRLMIWGGALLVITILGGGLITLFWHTRILETFSVQPRWEGGMIRVSIPAGPYRRVENGQRATLSPGGENEFEGRIKRLETRNGAMILWIDPASGVPDLKKIISVDRETKITLRSRRLIATFFRK